MQENTPQLWNISFSNKDSTFDEENTEKLSSIAWALCWLFLDLFLLLKLSKFQQISNFLFCKPGLTFLPAIRPSSIS